MQGCFPLGGRGLVVRDTFGRFWLGRGAFGRLYCVINAIAAGRATGCTASWICYIGHGYCSIRLLVLLLCSSAPRPLCSLVLCSCGCAGAVPSSVCAGWCPRKWCGDVVMQVIDRGAGLSGSPFGSQAIATAPGRISMQLRMYSGANTNHHLAGIIGRVEVASAPPASPPPHERFEPWSIGLTSGTLVLLRAAAAEHGMKPVPFARWIITEWLQAAGYLGRDSVG